MQGLIDRYSLPKGIRVKKQLPGLDESFIMFLARHKHLVSVKVLKRQQLWAGDFLSWVNELFFLHYFFTLRQIGASISRQDVPVRFWEVLEWQKNLLWTGWFSSVSTGSGPGHCVFFSRDLFSVHVSSTVSPLMCKGWGGDSSICFHCSGDVESQVVHRPPPCRPNMLPVCCGSVCSYGCKGSGGFSRQPFGAPGLGVSVGVMGSPSASLDGTPFPKHHSCSFFSL